MELEIKLYGDEVLRKKSDIIVDFNDDIKILANQMIEKCHKDYGVGLAAPQIGKSIRMFVLSIPPEDDLDSSDYNNFYEEVFINPIITQKKGKEKNEEGCLSIPGIYEVVERYKYINIEYQDINGEKKEIDNASGLLARAMQHEIDHLDGILFIDRLPVLKKSMVQKKIMKKFKRSENF